MRIWTYWSTETGNLLWDTVAPIIRRPASGMKTEKALFSLVTCSNGSKILQNYPSDIPLVYRETTLRIRDRVIGEWLELNSIVVMLDEKLSGRRYPKASAILPSCTVTYINRILHRFPLWFFVRSIRMVIGLGYVELHFSNYTYNMNK